MRRCYLFWQKKKVISISTGGMMAIVKCHECGSEVSTEAAACPKCGAKPKTKLSVIHWIGILVGLLIIYIIITAPDNQQVNNSAAVSIDSQATEATPPANTATEKEIYQTTSSRLFSDYEKNEVVLDEKIKDKKIILLGVIQAIDKDFMDNMIINLKTNNEFMPSRMQMNESQKSIVLERAKGDKVAITCKSIRRAMGSPSGRDCVFINPVKPLPDYS